MRGLEETRNGAWESWRVLTWRTDVAGSYKPSLWAKTSATASYDHNHHVSSLADTILPPGHRPLFLLPPFPRPHLSLPSRQRRGPKAGIWHCNWYWYVSSSSAHTSGLPLITVYRFGYYVCLMLLLHCAYADLIDCRSVTHVSGMS